MIWLNIVKVWGFEVPKNWGQGKVEVLALWPEISALRAEGRSIKSIYDRLKANGHVIVTYESFLQNVKKLAESNPAPSPSAPSAPAKRFSPAPRPSTSPRPVRAVSETTPAPERAPSADAPRPIFKMDLLTPKEDLTG